MENVVHMTPHEQHDSVQTIVQEEHIPEEQQVRVRFRSVYTERQRQCCDGTSELLQKWVETPIDRI